MRIFSAAFLAVLLAAALAHEVRAEAAIGALSGLTKMSWGGDTPDKGSYKDIYGFALGIEVDVRVHRSAWISLQPSFVQRGTKMSFEVRGERDRVDSVEVSLDYFTLPVLLKVETMGRRFYVTGGVEIARLLNARYRTPSEDSDAAVEIKENDFLIDFGVGYVIPAGRAGIVLEARYSQSMMNIGDEHLGDRYNIEARVKNRGLTFLVGVLYGF
jgi:hypothetical protein